MQLFFAENQYMILEVEGPRLPACGPSGWLWALRACLTLSFRAPYMMHVSLYVSMMYVSMMYVSMMPVTIMCVSMMCVSMMHVADYPAMSFFCLLTYTNTNKNPNANKLSWVIN